MIDKEELFRHIGARIAYYRKLRKLTQTELAGRANISRSSIARIEQGRYNHNISLAILLDIADGLEVDYLTLLTFDEKEKRTWRKEGSGISRQQ